MSHYEALKKRIEELHEENPGYQVVLFIHPVEYTAIADLDKLNVKIIKTKSTPLGSIGLNLYPKHYDISDTGAILETIKPKRKKFFGRVLDWLNRNKLEIIKTVFFIFANRKKKSS